ncbi:MAG: hypothetical protein E7397_00055 [Ruminococcaceae bacterium]|nr:hypothetical protein [Oscillospiraceae bacterium]
MKTLIELFDSEQLENLIAGLHFLPQKIVFVGFKNLMRPKKQELMEQIFSEHGAISVEYEYVSRNDFAQIVGRFNEIIDRNEDCCFDLTGGKDVVIAAMGAVAAQRNIPIIRYDVKKGSLIRVKDCECLEEDEIPYLTLEETFHLNGGSIVSGGPGFSWNLNADFSKDIDTIWSICSRNCTAWNRHAIAMAGISGRFDMDESFSVCADLRDRPILPDWDIMRELVNAGLLLNYQKRGGSVSFCYKNEQVFHALTKSGNALEVYTYLIAKELWEEGHFHDVKNGVMADWDGVIQTRYSTKKETRNEIDLMMMRGIIPIFASCKNGEVHKEALYELQTVARRFGGKYARKMLLATNLGPNELACEFIRQRAVDMKICVIEGINKMSRDAFKSALKEATK